MAYDFVVRFLSEMPEEQRENVFMQIPEKVLAQAVSVIEEKKVARDIAKQMLLKMSSEERQDIIREVSDER